MKKVPVFHPFLFAFFPIIFLYSHNVTQASLSEIFFPTAVTIIFTVLLWLLLSFLFKNNRKAALITTFFLICFFSFGRIYEAIRFLRIGETKIGRGGYLLIVMGAILLLGSYLIIKSRSNFYPLTRFLNVVASFLLAYQLTIVVYENISKEKIGSNAEFNAVELESTVRRPDIYYIILDAYARSDILKELYQYNNDYFLEFLSQRSFYVANRSTSNYRSTALALASSLNMTYLDTLVDREYKNPFSLKKMIKYSKVSQFLRKHGYTFVAFSTGYSLTEMDNADVFLSKSGLLSEFQTVLLSTTPTRKSLKRLSITIRTICKESECCLYLIASQLFVLHHLNSLWPILNVHVHRLCLAKMVNPPSHEGD